MSVAKIIEISANSSKSFEDAINNGIEKANDTVKGIQGAWINEMKVGVEDGKVTSYRVNMRVTFVIKD